MKQKLLGASRIAELVGISRQAVTKLFNKNWPDAKVGKSWNVYDPGVFDYLKSKDVDVVNSDLKSSKKRIDQQAKNPVNQRQDKHAKAGRGKSLQPDSSGLHANGGAYGEPPREMPDISDLPEMSLREIAFYHGTDEEFRGWADAFLKVQNGIEKQLKNEKTRGEVISREYVRRYVFSYLEELNSRLLVDSPAGVVEKIYAMAQSDIPKSEAIPEYVAELSKMMKDTKHNVKKNIESAK
ncbi:hypothetical protein NVP1191O_01 [Vibrio phage 1.191.O._10N.286.52.B4]|nr:hypothetical protein NVP1191O_01 [Vibrio phage 1.191.O._10N.286.52.B4]